MTKLQIAHVVASYVLGTSVGFTVRSVINSNVQPETLGEQAKITIGSIAIALVVAEKAKDSIENTVEAGKTVWAAVQEEKKKADLKVVPNN